MYIRDKIEDGETLNDLSTNAPIMVFHEIKLICIKSIRRWFFLFSFSLLFSLIMSSLRYTSINIVFADNTLSIINFDYI